jgi:hypothetical protein
MQDGRHLGFCFHRLQDKRLGQLIPFFCGLLGWLAESFFLWSALPLIQNGHYGCHLGFGYRWLSDKRLARLVRFVCGLLGVIGGRFLFTISTASHSRWPLRHPSWIWFPSINAWIDWLSTSRQDTWHTTPPDFAISPNSQRYNMQVRGICHAWRCRCCI